MGIYFASGCTATYFIYVTISMIYFWVKARKWHPVNCYINKVSDSRNNSYDKFLGEGNVPSYLSVNSNIEYVYSFGSINKKSEKVFLGDYFLGRSKYMLNPYSEIDLLEGDEVVGYYDPKDINYSVLYRLIPRKTIIYLSFWLVVTWAAWGGAAYHYGVSFYGMPPLVSIGVCFFLGFLLFIIDKLRATKYL